MSKELDYIQRHIDIVKQQVKCSKMKIIVTDVITNHQYDYYERELQTLESIEQALLRLEAIDNANPSEALKCLDKIAKQIELDEDTDYWEIRNAHKTVENALIKAQKEHKALEIIKKTKNIKVSFYENGSGKHYKIEFDKTRNQTITKEEFNLLKEVLE